MWISSGVLWFVFLFSMDVLLFIYDFHTGNSVNIGFDGFFLGVLFMIAVEWLDDRRK